VIVHGQPCAARLFFCHTGCVTRFRFSVLLLSIAVLLTGVCVLLLGVLLVQTVSKGDLVNETVVGNMKWLPGFVRGIDTLTDPFYRGPESSGALPYYALRVDPLQLRTVEHATKTNTDVYLVNDDAGVWVQGELVVEGEVLPIKMRVRGTRYNHWRFPKKSWRIDVRDGKLFRGMEEWNIIVPEDRAWFVDALSAWRAKQFDLLAAPMRFVTVSMNGSKPMLYLEVEHWTKEMLEKLGLLGDVNFYHAGEVGTSAFNSGWDPMREDMGYWEKYTQSAVAPQDSYEELHQLFVLLFEGQLLQDEAAKRIEILFDVDELVRWYALSLLAGDLHVGPGNARFFFDTSRGKFRPFVWDIHSTELKSLRETPSHVFWETLLPLPEWRERAYNFLREYVSDEENVREDFAEAERLRSLVEEVAYRDGQKFWSNRETRKNLDQRMAEVHGNIEFLQRECGL